MPRKKNRRKEIQKAKRAASKATRPRSRAHIAHVPVGSDMASIAALAGLLGGTAMLGRMQSREAP